RFVPHPYSSTPGARLYRSGDLARFLEDGRIEYLGRIDAQVKIRGFRIELGEIENRLAQYPTIRETLVLVRGEGQDKRLVAYVAVEQADALLDSGDEARQARQTLVGKLQTHLAQTLPDYMIPAEFAVLAKLPLTNNGKVDRRALPEPESIGGNDYVAPRTDTERALCLIWQDILNLPQVGIHDNFFRLGGHSLLATRVISRLNKDFSIALPLKAIFDAQTIAELSPAVARSSGLMAQAEIRPARRDQPLLPSYSQQLLWLIDQIEGGSAHFNMPGRIQLNGQLDIDALNWALGRILFRHESLRTGFVAGADGSPFQEIRPAEEFVAALVDYSELAPEVLDEKLDSLAAAEAGKPFDLARDPMLRVTVVKLAPQEHVLFATLHHIAADGWSMPILLREFATLYQARLRAEADPLPPLAIQYADYAQWQREHLIGEELERQCAYWERQLRGIPAVHSLPLDRPRPPRQSFVGRTVRSRIEQPVLNDLLSLCRKHGATLFMGLHAAFSALLARYSREEDIVVGSPIANREQMEVSGLVGFFVNTLVLRSDLSGAPGFRTLLERSRSMLLDAYAHQQVPIEHIGERLQVPRSLNHARLFQIMLVLQNNDQASLALPGLQSGPIELSGQLAKYDLSLYVNEEPHGLTLEWEYASDLFDESTIVRMAGHFEHLLGSMLQQPELSVWEAELLDAAERSLILESWSATAADYPQERCVHELFEDQAKRQPEAVAVEFEGATLSYGELNERANRLAGYLIAERAAGPDTLIGLCMERSLDVIVAVLGILKAGAA
ncbi:MAG TPA: condensation domain-containing protein, partial [Burkholderiaceae bacterium]